MRREARVVTRSCSPLRGVCSMEFARVVRCCHELPLATKGRQAESGGRAVSFFFPLLVAVSRRDEHAMFESMLAGRVLFAPGARAGKARSGNTSPADRCQVALHRIQYRLALLHVIRLWRCLGQMTAARSPRKRRVRPRLTSGRHAGYD